MYHVILRHLQCPPTFCGAPREKRLALIFLNHEPFNIETAVQMVSPGNVSGGFGSSVLISPKISLRDGKGLDWEGVSICFQLIKNFKKSLLLFCI